MAPSVTRALQAIKRYGAQPEQIDQTILAAINVTLCLASSGNDRVAEGFNSDIASSGRAARVIAARLVFSDAAMA
jgi:cell division protein ZapA (FtsZ GTPase activity inhibitor)